MQYETPSNPSVDTNIKRRYKVLRLLGSGAYGTVWKVEDRKTKKIYALKRIFDAFSNQRDAKRTYREITVQKQLRHENVIRLVKTMRSPNENDIYVLFEFMKIDIYGVLGGTNILQPIHKKFIMYQILCSLKYIHSANLIHRDITPSNILLDSECNVKLSDFGLVLKSGCKHSVKDYFQFSAYIAARRYNAPEILCGSTKYTSAVDIWSAGCVFGELIEKDGAPLFQGRSVSHQLGLIMRITGKPTRRDIDSIPSLHAKKLIQSVPVYKKLEHFKSHESRMKYVRTSLRKKFPITTDKEAIDLLSKLLVFDRNQRMSASEALKHPYLAEFYDGEELNCGKEIILKLEEENPGRKITTKEYRNFLLGNNIKESIMSKGIGKKHFGLKRKKKKPIPRPVTSPVQPTYYAVPKQSPKRKKSVVSTPIENEKSIIEKISSSSSTSTTTTTLSSIPKYKQRSSPVKLIRKKKKKKSIINTRKKSSVILLKKKKKKKGKTIMMKKRKVIVNTKCINTKAKKKSPIINKNNNKRNSVVLLLSKNNKKKRKKKVKKVKRSSGVMGSTKTKFQKGVAKRRKGAVVKTSTPQTSKLKDFVF